MVHVFLLLIIVFTLLDESENLDKFVEEVEDFIYCASCQTFSGVCLCNMKMYDGLLFNVKFYLLIFLNQHYSEQKLQKFSEIKAGLDDADVLVLR